MTDPRPLHEPQRAAGILPAEKARLCRRDVGSTLPGGKYFAKVHGPNACAKRMEASHERTQCSARSGRAAVLCRFANRTRWRKRQRTAALQDADALARAPFRFLGSLRGRPVVSSSHEPLAAERQALLCALRSGRAMPLFFKSLWPLLAFVLLAGCRTASPMPPVNVREPGWNVQQGQAVWRSRRNAPEIAGELVVAMHPDGRSLVQFTKTPLPFVVAQATIDSWQVQFVPQNKVYSGRGQPPAQLIWLHLPQCLRGGDPPEDLLWRQLANQGWRLENRSTGESLEGYLAP